MGLPGDVFSFRGISLWAAFLSLFQIRYTTARVLTTVGVAAT